MNYSYHAAAKMSISVAVPPIDKSNDVILLGIEIMLILLKHKEAVNSKLR